MKTSRIRIKSLYGVTEQRNSTISAEISFTRSAKLQFIATRTTNDSELIVTEL